MIKYSALLTISMLCASVPAMAQTTPAAPDPAMAPAATQAAPAAAPAMTKDGKPAMKDVRMQCRDQVKASNAKGEERRQAMQACIIQQRPDMEAHIKCQMDPSLKGMDKAAKHAAVKSCIQKSKS